MDNILVADIMTRDPVTAKPEINLLDCAKNMIKKKVGSLLLVEKKRLVGIISEKDILWALVKTSTQDLTKIKAVDISPKKIATIKPSMSVREALEKMKKLGFERLPVIHEKELVGIITARDILNFQPQLYPELEEFAQIREEAQKLKRFQKAKDGREGICEECGKYDFLYRVHENFICEECKEKM